MKDDDRTRKPHAETTEQTDHDPTHHITLEAGASPISPPPDPTVTPEPAVTPEAHDDGQDESVNAEPNDSYKRSAWIPWAIGAIGLIILLYLIWR